MQQKELMNRKQLNYFTDLILIPLFILTLYTGIELHVAGHGVNHEIWHLWAVFHTIAGLLFTILGIMHIDIHRGWYKGLRKKGFKGKRKIVLILSVVFVLVVTTGALLLFCAEGGNSSVGLLHYKAGLAMGALGILHILKRMRFFIH